MTTTPSEGILISNDENVKLLTQYMVSGERSLKHFPSMLQTVIHEEAWRHRYVRQVRKEVVYERFADFITDHPPEGLGSTIDQVRALCREDTAATIALDRVLTGKPGGNGNNQYMGGTCAISTGSTRPRGSTHRSTIVERLSRDRHDLYARVVAKEISAREAAIEAGWVKPTITVPADPEDAARVLLKKFTGDDLRRLIGLLQA